MNKKWEMDRRTFIKAAGLALGLPALEAMYPSWIRAARAAGGAKPLIWWHSVFPNGWDCPGDFGNIWRMVPPVVHDAFDSIKGDCVYNHGLNSKILKDHEKTLQILSNGTGDGHGSKSISMNSIAQPDSTAISPDHGGCGSKSGAWMWRPKQTQMWTLSQDPKYKNLSIPLLSVAADRNGGVDCFHRGEVSEFHQADDQGKYVSTYENPRDIYNLLVGANGNGAPVDYGYQKSVLDSAMSETKSLMAKLGKSDKEKVAAHWDSMRELEKRIAALEQQGGENSPMACNSLGNGPRNYSGDDLNNPNLFVERFNLIRDLIITGISCGKTQLIHHMFATEGSDPRGIPDYKSAWGGSWHSHSAASSIFVSRWACQQMKTFVDRVKALKDPDGESTFNRCLLTITANQGRFHDHITGFHVISAGDLQGRLKKGIEVDHNDGELASLWYTYMKAMGWNGNSFVVNQVNSRIANFT